MEKTVGIPRRFGDRGEFPAVNVVPAPGSSPRNRGAYPTMAGGKRRVPLRTRPIVIDPGRGEKIHATRRARGARLDSRLQDEASMSDPLDHHEGNGPPTDENHRRVIAIDGPAAAGKTTVARALAARLGATYLDTGLLYRAVTLAAIRAGVALSDGDAIAHLTRNSRFKIVPPATPDGVEELVLDGQLVTPELRTAEIDRQVSTVAAHPAVRAALLPIQREIAASGPVVMVGRDITTVVVPDAGVKIFLNASTAERARRRLKEIEGRGAGSNFDEVLREIERRDHLDSTRPTAPLRAGDRVTIVETDGRTVSDIVDEIAALAKRVWYDESRASPSAGER